MSQVGNNYTEYVTVLIFFIIAIEVEDYKLLKRHSTAMRTAQGTNLFTSVKYYKAQTVTICQIPETYVAAKYKTIIVIDHVQFWDRPWITRPPQLTQP